MSSGITLSKSMCLKTQDERTRMSMTPYDSAIGSIMYAIDSCHSRVIGNQQNLYPRVPTTVAKLLRNSGSRVEHRDEFSSYK